ncbi:hypothetical protein AQJ27_35715 [Streptomyces olivochromogenes]|uniref:Uncharacterized protein n=1 Tax=Streptomyces olivochromogenes TaxID=1963 RepID=A0A250VQS5_STROL|nr:hypothetical protein AQJ27_35715 [Streptomyces olivochromogenes]GAX56573.1 hypothetical protein SO3561_08141 [Streptomyces olivochromogenes]
MSSLCAGAQRAGILLVGRTDTVTLPFGKGIQPGFERRGPANEFGTRHDFVFHVDGDPSREVRLAVRRFHLRLLGADD